MSSDAIRVMIGGSYQVSDGYPNVKWLLESMENDARFSVTYAGTGHAGWGHFSKRGNTYLGLMVQGAKVFGAAVKEFLAIVRSAKRSEFDILYVPYPALPMLLLLSCVPQRYRPLVVADSFISVFDTLINDRGMFGRQGILASLVFKIERRALTVASRVLVDTDCNRRFVKELFSLPDDRLRAIPLATDESHYVPLPYRGEKEVCTVLFIGTFVPLHGVETVAQAILLLSDRADIRFRMFGDGQAAANIRQILADKECHLEWQRDWTHPSQLAKEMEKADICLGIFGTTDKAARVWPLKNYAAMRVGRAVVSEFTTCIPGWHEGGDDMPASLVAAGDARQLADRLLYLAQDYRARKKIADMGRRYYEDHLSNARVMDALHETMLDLMAR